jgi:regulator of nonsense transcripts 1
LHLVKAKHKEISLHPEGSHGDTHLECYVCGNKNIFLLGFVPIQAQEESQVIIICRLPCLNQKSFNDLQWDPSDWTALVEEKMLVNWLVKPPSDRDMRRARPITIEQINELEEARKTNPDVKLEDLRKPGKEKALKSVSTKYEDGKDYCETFLPLIEKEAQYDKKVKESQVIT